MIAVKVLRAASMRLQLFGKVATFHTKLYRSAIDNRGERFRAIADHEEGAHQAGGVLAWRRDH